MFTVASAIVRMMLLWYFASSSDCSSKKMLVNELQGYRIDSSAMSTLRFNRTRTKSTGEDRVNAVSGLGHHIAGGNAVGIVKARWA